MPSRAGPPARLALSSNPDTSAVLPRSLGVEACRYRWLQACPWAGESETMHAGPRKSGGASSASARPRLHRRPNVSVRGSDQSAAHLLAVAVSAALLIFGGHLLLRHLLGPAPNPAHASRVLASAVGKIRLPANVRVGSILTIHCELPPGESGTVSVEGAYGRPPWQTLAVAARSGNAYAARIHLGRTGLLHLRITYPDGHRAVGAVRVIRAQP